MCLVALALDQSSRFPFVLAANRDEFMARPSARLGWWEPEGGGPPFWEAAIWKQAEPGSA